MSRPAFKIVATVCFLAIGACGQDNTSKTFNNEFTRNDVQAVIVENTGSYGRPIGTTSEEAQQFFDQGLRLTWGYFFPDAAASYLEALRHDPNNPMIYWGLAMASGPNPNSRYTGTPDDPKGSAKRAIEIAADLSDSADEVTRAMIKAVVIRYDNERYPDQAKRDSAYLSAIRDLYQRYPDDPDIVAMYADAFMVTMPWTYWSDDGSPAAGTAEVIAALEASMDRHPMHPGTNHLYIHMLEASTQPERALPQAERLPEIMPVAGHIVHMPTHIFVRVGEFEKAIDLNERSVAVDKEFQDQWGELPYPDFVTYPLSARLHATHSQDFIRYAATMNGDYERALEAAEAAEKIVLARAPLSNGRTQRTIAATWLLHKVFENWEAILTGDGPPEHGHQYLDGLWAYVTGSAYVGVGSLNEARFALESLAELAATDTPDEIRVLVTPPSTILKLAEFDLGGQIALAEGNTAAAIEALRSAVEIEDGLGYMEPPDWPHSTRIALGEALMAAGDTESAEAVYREDLDWNRGNTWAMAGLCASFAAQGKVSEECEQVPAFKTPSQ